MIIASNGSRVGRLAIVGSPDISPIKESKLDHPLEDNKALQNNIFFSD